MLSGAAIVVTAGVAALVGLALGGPAARSAATGLYLVGGFLVVLGVFNGLRGPVRPKGGDDDHEPIGGILGFGIFSGGIRPQVRTSVRTRGRRPGCSSRWGSR